MIAIMVVLVVVVTVMVVTRTDGCGRKFVMVGIVMVVTEIVVLVVVEAVMLVFVVRDGSQIRGSHLSWCTTEFYF